MSEDRNAHPDEQRFSLYVLDALDAEQVAAFEGHIRACSACEHKLAMEAELEVALLANARELTHEPLAPRASKSATLVGAALVAAAAAVVLVARLGDRPMTAPTVAPKAGAALPAASAASVNVVMPTQGTIASIEARVGSQVRCGQMVAKLDDSAAQADLAAGNVEVRVAEEELKTKALLFKAQVVTELDLKQAEAAVAVARSKLFAMSARVEQAKLRAPVDGTVIEILARPGNTLAWGAPVMKLSEDKPQSKVVVTDVDVDEPCRVASVEVGPGTQVKREQLVLRCHASAERARAIADLASAEHDFKRTVQLRELGEVPNREFLQAQEVIAAARALVSRQHREQLEIRAPIDGTVLGVFAHAGEILAPHATAMQLLASSDAPYIIVTGVIAPRSAKNHASAHTVAEADVSESQLPELALAEEVQLTTDNDPFLVRAGHVESVVSPSADKRVGTVQVWVELGVRDSALSPGTTVAMRFKRLSH